MDRIEFIKSLNCEKHMTQFHTYIMEVYNIADGCGCFVNFQEQNDCIKFILTSNNIPGLNLYIMAKFANDRYVTINTTTTNIEITIPKELHM